MNIQLSSKYFGRILAVTVLLLLSIALFFPYLTVLSLAAVFAFALDPYIQRIRDSGIKSRSVGAGIIVGFLLLTVTGPILFAFYQLYVKVMELELVGNPQAMRDKALTLSNKINAQISVLAKQVGFQGDTSSATSDILNRASEAAISGGTYLVTQLPEILFLVFIFSIGTYYFLSQSRRLHNLLEDCGLFTRHEVFHLINALRVASRSAVISSVITGLIQAIVVAIGVQVAGYALFSTIFVVTFFVSFIPVVGAAPVALVMMVAAIAEGNQAGVFILLATSLLAGTIDNILRPYLIGGTEEDIHPILTLLAIFGGVTVFGLPGLFLGPVIISTAYKIIPLFIERIRKDEEAIEESELVEIPPDPLHRPIHFQ